MEVSGAPWRSSGGFERARNVPKKNHTLPGAWAGQQGRGGEGRGKGEGVNNSRSYTYNAPVGYLSRGTSLVYCGTKSCHKNASFGVRFKAS